MEMAIQQLKATERISYPEARRRLYGNTRTLPSTSYATAAATPSPVRNMFNIQDLVAALVPELCRALGLEPKVSEAAPSYEEPALAGNRPSSTVTLKNAVPTSVLRKKLTTASSAPIRNTQQSRQYDGSKVESGFEKNNVNKQMRPKLKRNKTDAASSSVASVADEHSLNQHTDESSSSSGAQPSKRKSQHTLVTRESGKTDPEEDMDIMFEATPKNQVNSEPRQAEAKPRSSKINKS